MKKPQENVPEKQMRRARISSRLPTSVNGVKCFTRDISRSGLYIVQSSKLEIGSHIDFWINLDTPGGKLKLSCEGNVVRVEEVDGKFGIGVKILSQVIEGNE
jgi:hypothetical protein